jgi:RNA-directed DNA polymerase
MKRAALGLETIADWHTLTTAFHRAALGKSQRAEVRSFRAELWEQLAQLRHDILAGTVAVGQMRAFHIRDPKPRLIHAPCFRERVLHHALMAHAGPVLERSLVDDSFACRVGKGALAAVKRAQQHSRCYAWYGQIDIMSYFASIDHVRLFGVLARRFKNPGLLALFTRIITAHQDRPGQGLPIGALTSQHFANAYLGTLDRFVLEQCGAGGFVRYMDDLVWWSASKAEAQHVLGAVRQFATEQLGLTVKHTARIGRSADGVNLCGFRILPGRLLLSRRRKRRYCAARQGWEQADLLGRIDPLRLQAGYAAALAITAHADACAWRQQQLCRQPVALVLEDL